jgi:Holliday junction resolvase RusA-like endonuclease
VSILIEVYGTPAPQGSKKAFAIRKGGVYTGKVAMAESSKERVKSWRQAVLEAAESAHACVLDPGPVTLGVCFWMRRPAGHYGTGRNAMKVRPSAPAVPAGKPDLSKLVRATEDALTDAGVWKDDAQVVDIVATKRYADRRRPGASINVLPWTPDGA